MSQSIQISTFNKQNHKGNIFCHHSPFLRVFLWQKLKASSLKPQFFPSTQVCWCKSIKNHIKDDKTSKVVSKFQLFPKVWKYFHERWFVLLKHILNLCTFTKHGKGLSHFLSYKLIIGRSSSFKNISSSIISAPTHTSL